MYEAGILLCPRFVAGKVKWLENTRGKSGCCRYFLGGGKKFFENFKNKNRIGFFDPLDLKWYDFKEICNFNIGTGLSFMCSKIF